jgi:signal transduction histidine kinase
MSRENRLLPVGFAAAGGIAAVAATAGRPGAALLLLGAAWLAAAAALLRAAPRSPAQRLLALGLVAGAAAMSVPALAVPAGWLLAACLVAAFAVREGLEGSAADGWGVVVDSLLIGSSLGAIHHAVGAGAGQAPALPWVAAAATAVAAPWVGGCTRGTGATLSTLLTLGASLSLIVAVASSEGVPAALWSGAALALVARVAGRGDLVSPLLMGSPAQRRRCRRARLGTTLVVPLLAIAAAALVALKGEPTPRAQVLTLAVLGCAAIFRSRLVAGPATAAGCAAPGGESSERLAALGEYTRLVAHEVRNSLSVLFSTTDLLRRDRDAEQRRELLDVMTEEGDRVRDVIDQMTAFVGEGHAGERARLRLREIAREAAERALDRPAWPEGLTINLDLAGGDDVVVGDASRLELAVSHVLVAAAQGGATGVTMESRREGATRRLVVKGDGRAGADVSAPSPSTLLAGRASGGNAALGLAVAQRTLREHGGELRLSRADSGGLNAVVELPAETA